MINQSINQSIMKIIHDEDDDLPNNKILTEEGMEKTEGKAESIGFGERDVEEKGVSISIKPSRP